MVESIFIWKKKNLLHALFSVFFFFKRSTLQNKNCDFYVAVLSIDSLRSKHI